MQYRVFTRGRDELNRKIEAVEREHYLVSLDLAVAEGKKDDAMILQHQDTLARLETGLAALYDQHGK